MSILVRYAPSSMTADQYDEVTEKVQAKTEWPPDGLQLHVCFGSGDSLKVSEVWESREQMDAFGEHLLPVLSEVGIAQNAPPEFLEVHALMVGSNHEAT